jgi:hypothetical protein
MANHRRRTSLAAVAAAVLLATSPPAPAAAASDPRATALADEVMKALGGASAWSATRYLRFDFAVEGEGKTILSRAHTWDKATGRYRLEGKDKEGQAFLTVMNLNTKSGSAWLAGRRLSGRQERKQLDNAHAAWINDTYWLLMPYKLKDPGVNLAYDGDEASGGSEWAKLLLTFDDVGLTPKDKYWVYVNKKTHLVDRWDYILDGARGPATTFLWKGWKAYGRIQLAPERVDPQKGTRIFFPVLEAPASVPDSAFAAPPETR